MSFAFLRLLAVIFTTTCATWGQGVLSFRFQGVVTDSQPGGNSVYFPIAIGTRVDGVFSIDTAVSDRNIPELELGVFESSRHFYSLNFEGYRDFVLPTHGNNTAITEDGSIGMADSFSIRLFPPTGFDFWRLRFVDPNGTVMKNDHMITTADHFNQFAYATLDHSSSSISGRYTMSFQVSPVPEPSSLAFVILGSLFLWNHFYKSKSRYHSHSIAH
jgi:hypothetical protein